MLQRVTRGMAKENPDAFGDLICLQDGDFRRRRGDAVQNGGTLGPAADPPPAVYRKEGHHSGRSNASTTSSRKSTASQKARKAREIELDRERQLYEMRRVDREEAKRLIEMEANAKLAALDEEEEDDDHVSVISRNSGGPDVDQLAKTMEWVLEKQVDYRGEDLSRAHKTDASYRYACRPIAKKSAHPDDALLTEDKEKSYCDKMAASIATAMTSAIQSVSQPADGMKSFMARQTCGKDLPEFHGDPEEWPTFIARFKTSTRLCGFSKEENVLRLQKCLKGKARETVHAMLSSGANLNCILDVLEKRFGRPEFIIKRMIEKARSVIPPVEGDFRSLLDFSIAVKNLYATAEALNLPLYVNNPQLVEEFRRKLPPHLQLDWGRFVEKSGKKICGLLELSKFLDEISSAAVHICDDVPTNERKKNRQQCMMAIGEIKCPLGCSNGHFLEMCPKLMTMSVKERWDAVKKMDVCFTCLKKGHRNGGCPLPVECGVNGCSKYHHPILHYVPRKRWQPSKRRTPPQNKEPVTPKTAEPSTSAVAQVMGAISHQKLPVGEKILRIAPVELTGPKGSIVVNAFLDGGSGPTLIETEVADYLGLDGATVPLHISWQGGKMDSDLKSRIVSLKIRGVDEKEEFVLDNVRTKTNLEIPMQPLSSYKPLKKWSHLNDVPFPEVLPKRPSLVLGVEHNYLLLDRKIVEGPRNAPAATWTYLGWVVSGKNGKGSKGRTTAMMGVQETDPDVLLHELVKEQFRLESLGVVNCPKLPQSSQNQRAELLMETLARRDGVNWVAPMLWKTDDLGLPESFRAALSRLRLLEKKLDKDEETAKLYDLKIEEYQAKGFCRKLSSEEAAVPAKREWFIPHFGTTNPNKPGKVRLVFDCAEKTNGTSLNDALLQGPDLMTPLINVLLKFRQYEYAFSGDIRDMFHMVKICQEDGASLRFLWRGRDRNRSPDIYQMDVMVFGAVSSPFQAQWVKNQNARDFQDQFPEAVDAIINRHYVDDYLDSCKTPEEAIRKIMDVREIHRRGGFEIRGWLSNSEDVLKVVAPGEQVAATKNVKEDDLERVLGLHWNPKNDIFTFKTKFARVDPEIISDTHIPTKRQLLKIIMSLFDPLGFVAHLTVRGRILLQDVWRSGIGWDEKLKVEQLPKWRSFLCQLMKIPEAVIPRCFAPDISACQDLQLHVMCDASQQAFCAVAYLRVNGRGGAISVNIVVAKSRVTPIRAVSIPRLELEAALIGARLSKFVREGLDLPISRTVLWSDSRNVLCWIRAEDPGRFKMYVAHRIGEILDLTEKTDWRWVPTAENVADDATRDHDDADVTPTSRWFRGPSFLWEPESQWPVESELPRAKDEDLEVKKCIMAVVEVGEVIECEKFSSWGRLIRVTAWVLRAVRLFKAKGNRDAADKKKYLGVAETRDAVKLWITWVQETMFAEELTALQEGKPISLSSRISKCSPKLLDGALCVDSRLVKSPDLQFSAKYPVILDSKHPWTKLLIAWYHQLHGHVGQEKILNELRQKYWIVNAKSAVKKAAYDCLECRMRTAKQVPPMMAALPEVRVKMPTRPFTFTGVDYFGPLDVVNGRKREKRYGVLFTCLSTRAVHLEMAYSLSADDFIMALHRFICRRGKPEEIWSDNGTNFRGAETELQKALKEMDTGKVEEKMAAQDITWKFIPPGSLHFGGAWERLVRSVKTAITVILRNRTLSDQLLLTILSEAEASVNSRPLTTVSCDKDDPEAITPNNFLIGTTSIQQPPGVFDDSDLCSRKRWRQAQVLANHFWSRWLKEYLPSLSLRSKWHKDTPDVVVGELVYIPDVNQLRNEWTKGVIQAVFPGKDGKIRVADVKTAGGTFQRPVARLYRIPGWNEL